MEAVIYARVADDIKEFKEKLAKIQKQFISDQDTLINLINAAFKSRAKLIHQNIRYMTYEIFNEQKDMIYPGTTYPVGVLITGNSDYAVDGIISKLVEYYNKATGYKCEIQYNYIDDKNIILQLTINKN